MPSPLGPLKNNDLALRARGSAIILYIKKIRPCLNTPHAQNTQTPYAQKFFFYLSVFTCIFYVLSPRTVYIKLSNFFLFSHENDDTESSKRCVVSLVFIIRC